MSDLDRWFLLDSPSPSFDPIAFTAHAHTKVYDTAGQTITFDDVTTNIGDAFDAPTGVFTCPVTGVYVFHASITSSDTTSFVADFVTDDSYLVTIYSDDTYERQSPNMAATECTAGKVVFLSSHA